ncbi:helix-turn-helix domain-containing protein [Virgibacillus pantothenticus]|uniref:helix-turn-helix domain-containing protein n=1 Tax=Virgibacillus pantothenticus TaxID=1473 RepID=UPI001C23BA27|nr:helix-turn-helix transcriptional regulator [Virgibacillus pantothenticus]MBU8568736.1 helix-turn-helix domain-containing protein [Virgibacillus pantothenticus]MBU8602733.1 helix-turn-helix domain-containing protein [Virgibacillus pantothenticus]MBU8636854.1 helix-turn-helix domain-containing protein [Virgibacillus pantothenticus]MBU8644590.1 helix-turn-helix domain-containing protein [Virgibacillus pantothenticus]MBU8648687.1 helix-turn-helix domain-containing protein [Virgibacillus pantoth
MCSFSERLIDLRVEAGYSQKEIAAMLNMTASAYGYYEQGKNEPSINTLKKIATIYNVSTDYLVGTIDTPTHQINFFITEHFSLTESELTVVKQMKEKQLLAEMEDNPTVNVDKLVRFWTFLTKEMNGG